MIDETKAREWLETLRGRLDATVNNATMAAGYAGGIAALLIVLEEDD